MDPWEDTQELLAELWGQLRCSPGGVPSAPQPPSSQACDRTLRLCVEQLARPGGSPAQVGSLVAVAEAACQGYLSLVPRPPPLYLEKILYHLLRNVASRGRAAACWRVAELLRARLLTYRHGQAPAKDFTTVAYSSFSLLWREAEALAQPEQPQQGAGGALSARLRALRFLLLLEQPGTAPPALQPPFFASQTAQQAAAAIATARAPPPALVAQQLRDHLLGALQEEGRRPPSLQQRLCFFELTLELCRQLCRGSLHQRALEALEEARSFLGTSKCFGGLLSLLEAGVQLSRVVAGSSCPTRSPFSQALVALGMVTEASEQLLRVLAESCQFLVSFLGELMKKSKQQPLGQEEVLSFCAFTKRHCQVLQQLLEKVPAGAARQQLLVKQLLYRNLQLFTNVLYDTCQSPQMLPLAQWSGLEQLRSSCVRSLRWMLEALEGLPESERTKYLDVTASCTFRLAYIFYSQDMHQEAITICKGFCERLQQGDAFMCPEIPPERLHKCFRLQVESLRKLGQLERALGCVVQWLVALQGRLGDLLAEPVALWVRVKVDVAKQGPEELRLRTLKDGLEGHNLDVDTLVGILFAELKAYKAVRGDTGQERYSVLCDLLQLCPEGSSQQQQQRAASLTELAQLLCYHSYAQQTECSSLDSIHEALRLLEMVPRSSQNQDQLLDDQAQALLWLYICTLESNIQKGIEREQRAKAQGLKPLEEFEPNDLGYEGRLLEDRFLYDGITSNLLTDTALSKSLDDALALWKQLLPGPRVPALRSPEQTVASLQLLAALYKLMAKPLQALESYLLLRALCSALGDSLGAAGALCQLTRLLCQLDCPSYAQVFLEEAESCLQGADSSQDSFLLLQQTCLVLRSQLCCATHQVQEGLSLLLGVLQNPALQRAMKVWYLLRAQALCLLTTYLSLPPAHLPPELRQQILVQGWRSPMAALVDAQKLLRSILLLLLGGALLGCQEAASDAHFVDCGDNVLLKWQVLGDMLAASEQLVALLSRLEVVCRAKAFCLEAVKVAMKLQAVRWCTSFLVLKAQLELQQSELELSHSDLQQALFILESDTEFGSKQKQRGQAKILLRKAKLQGQQPPAPSSQPPEEEEGFLQGPDLARVPALGAPETREALTASPELKPPRRRSLAFLSHPAACSCCLCCDPALCALCLRWQLCSARAALAAGAVPEGLALLRALPPRRAAAAAACAARLGAALRGGRPGPEPPGLPTPEPPAAACAARLGAALRGGRPGPEPPGLPTPEPPAAACTARLGAALRGGCPGPEPPLAAARLGAALRGGRPGPEPPGLPTPEPPAAACTARLGAALRGGCPGLEPPLPAPGLLAEPLAAAYAALALQSLAGPRPAEELQEELEEGLGFLASCGPQLPGLGVARASLLLAKAAAGLCRLASERGGSVDGVLASSWAWRPPSAPAAEPGVPTAPQSLKLAKAAPLEPAPPKRRPKKPLAPAAPKPGVRKSQRAKAQALPGTKDIFALGDSDSEVPTITLRPGPGPCTPCHKSCPLPTKPGLAPGPRTPFTIFSESSPPPGRSRLLRAPRAVGKVKSRLQVIFSDDSDQEQPQAELPPRATRKASCAARQALSPRPTAGCQGSMKGSGGHRSGAQPRRGRPGTHRAGAGGEKKERGGRRAASRRAEEDLDLLRAAEEQGQKELELSFEALQVCQEEEGAPGRSQECRQQQDGQQQAGQDVPAAPGPGTGDPLNPQGSISSTLPMAGGVSSLDTVLGLLKDAFNCIRHCPPATLYSQLCQLLAQALGDQDPLLTACLLSESVCITTRHELLHILHRKLHKEKKAAGDMAEQLQGLSLQQGGSAQPGQHLTELQELFTFSCRELGPEDRDSFQAQLQQIPSGVTVCLLALASTQPGCVGDTLLLTRLERAAAPLSLCIPTRLSKAPLSSVLSDFGTIQKEQKETNSCRDREQWWLRRLELDQRMKSLIETLEKQVLGCWRAALLPPSPQPGLEEEAAQLHSQLRRHGWRGLDPTLLKVVLNAAPLLTSQDVQALACSLCPGQPHKAQLLLEEAVEKRRACSTQPSGSLILVLDKHLQKLPWENISCLKALPVTRLPSLRFLLSYSLAQKHQAGAVLSRGVDPSSTFYVLNPSSNLLGTEERFRAWFESEPGWKGVTRAVPSQQQMEAALLEHDLYIYAGHGAGARLLDGQAIARLRCRAVAFLFGCSSAALEVRGGLEGSGIVLKYIMAGCPLVLGNLWDVTDRDIDRYAQALLQGWLRGGPGTPLLPHVAQARQAPKLKFLIGAAPVAYGLPVSLR